MIAFQPTPALMKAAQRIAEDLFATLNPGRVGVRVVTTNDREFPVLGEVCAPGLMSVTGGMTLQGYKARDVRLSPTIQLLQKERRPIIQRDVAVDPPAMPHLPDFGGVHSQMLAPVEYEGNLVGAIVVHNVEPRDWSEDDIAALQDATARVEAELERSVWFDLD